MLNRCLSKITKSYIYMYTYHPRAYLYIYYIYIPVQCIFHHVIWGCIGHDNEQKQEEIFSLDKDVEELLQCLGCCLSLGPRAGNPAGPGGRRRTWASCCTTHGPFGDLAALARCGWETLSWKSSNVFILYDAGIKVCLVSILSTRFSSCELRVYIFGVVQKPPNEMIMMIIMTMRCP